MSSFKLERYCCVFPLRTGAISIAGVSISYTITSLITSIFRLNQFSYALDEINELQGEMSNNGNENLVNRKSKENQEAVAMAARIFNGIYVAIIIMSLVNLIPDILLINGIKKNNSKYLIPWLSIRGFEFFICFILLLLMLAFDVLPTTFMDIIFIFLFVFFYIYHWLVIYSLYLHLMENNDNYHTQNMLPSVATKV